MNLRQLQSTFLSKDARMKFKLLSLAVGFVLTGGAAQYATPISKIPPRSFLLLLNMKLKVNTQHPKIICDIPVQITWFALFSWKGIFPAHLRQLFSRCSRGLWGDAWKLWIVEAKLLDETLSKSPILICPKAKTHFLSFIFAQGLLFQTQKYIIHGSCNLLPHAVSSPVNDSFP